MKNSFLISVIITLIFATGNSYSQEQSVQKVQSINLKDLTESRMFLLPRPFPGFLPFWYSAKSKKQFNLAEIERIQLLVPVEGNEELSGFEFTSVTLK